MRKIIAIMAALAVAAPASAAPKYAFPISNCNVTYAHVHHDYPATDILGKKGCKYVAVTAGTIDELRKVDTYNYKKPTGDTKGGIFISLVGDDGVRYYGSHLQKIATGIELGQHVEAGTLLGYLGDSGDARGTAPHVHFGISWPTEANIWWVRRGELYPWKYLDAWKAGKDISPANSIAKLKAQIGEVPPIPKK